MRRSFPATVLTLAALASIPSACQNNLAAKAPTITISEVPPAGQGGPERMGTISGRVDGVTSNSRVVLFTKTHLWYVQPFRSKPYTVLRPDLTWTASVHLGTEYAALLVRPAYSPPATLDTIPEVGGDVLAVSRVAGRGSVHTRSVEAPTLRFSGYDWQARQLPSERGGFNLYDDRNVRVSSDGALHLSIANRDAQWSSAEVTLSKTLGYGTYVFVVRNLSQLDPAAMLTFFTYDNEGPLGNREMDIQIQRRQGLRAAGGQYIVQPNNIVGNTARFDVPVDTATFTMRWEPGRVIFATTRGSGLGQPSSKAGRHDFTVGVPATGKERIRINLCYFRKSAEPPERDVEVVIERFQYLP
jgi:hypothetical protein